MVGILQWELSLTLLVKSNVCWLECAIYVEYVVLEVGFTSGQFTGSESSGFIEVIVGLAGGTSSAPITVTVTPSVQSPVSAMGMYVVTKHIHRIFMR